MNGSIDYNNGGGGRGESASPPPPPVEVLQYLISVKEFKVEIQEGCLVEIKRLFNYVIKMFCYSSGIFTCAIRTYFG